MRYPYIETAFTLTAALALNGWPALDFNLPAADNEGSGAADIAMLHAGKVAR